MLVWFDSLLHQWMPTLGKRGKIIPLLARDSEGDRMEVWCWNAWYPPGTQSVERGEMQWVGVEAASEMQSVVVVVVEPEAEVSQESWPEMSLDPQRSRTVVCVGGPTNT